MKMKEQLLTVALSVATTLMITRWLDGTGGNPVLAADQESVKELIVDRLIVREELIVSDTGKPWDDGFEQHQIPRGIVVRSLAAGPDGKPGTAGLWVRSRIIKSEIDDPFDDRFHAINRDGSIFKAPGHISWNVWLDGAWRQVTNIQGEGLEYSEMPRDQWSGGNHPGRLRFQSFRPHHGEPLTDVVLGQGKMSIGGGGYGGGGLPYPREVLELWGGEVAPHPLATPSAPIVINDDASGERRYALVAVGAQGRESAMSGAVRAGGRARLQWDSVPGGDAYVVVRDGKRVTGLLRIEGAVKEWSDRDPAPKP